MHNYSEAKVNQLFSDYSENSPGKFIAGYGTIAKGILGTEKLLTLEQLRKDLINAKTNQLNEVIIFRLGGLNKNYSKIIKEFSDI